MPRILITGTSSGSSRAIVVQFLDLGCDVIATMRNPCAEGLPVSDNLRLLPLDVTDANSIATAFAEPGPLDALVNNAGVDMLNVLEGAEINPSNRGFEMNRLITLCRTLPTPDPGLTVAYTPIRLEMHGRQPLELRLTAPATGDGLPIVILSHGFGPSKYIPSKDGYAPLAQFWAERGIALIQPTHASSRVGGLDPDLPEGPFFWRERVFEMRAILDQLAEIERQAPAIGGRLDHDRIAVAGHSFGGQTCSLLLGARLQREDFSDPRIRAGILLATPGRGGVDLTPENAARFPFFDVDFGGIELPTLVVCGAEDDPHFTPRGPEWHADAFHDAPGADALRDR